MSSPRTPCTRDKDKLLTAVSCHVQDYTVLRGRAVHVAVQENTETVSLIREGIPHSVRTLPSNIQGIYCIMLQLPRSALI